MEGYQCLIIDDEISIAETTAEYFNMFDIKSIYATSYEEGFKMLDQYKVELILLDINLGEKSGFEFCREMRKNSNVPILFISARTSNDDILTALNIGGDDYITKPYTLNILLAKVKAVLKRCTLAAEPKKKLEQQTTFEINKDLKLDYNYRQLLRKGEAVKLREMEFKLLDYFIKNSNRVIPKEEIFEKVWDSQYVGDGTLNVHIRHLREKVEEIPNEPRYIKTVWGVGYIFELLKD